MKRVRGGKAAARKITRARVLLKADAGTGGPGWTDPRIAETLEVGVRTVENLRRRCVEEGLEASVARPIRTLVDVEYPEADRITLVMDTLNTHAMASLYEAFTPTEARRLIERQEPVYPPKHGSWLDIAEIELNVLARPCLDRRIPDKPTLVKETGAWECDRNAVRKPVDWRFTTDHARIKLKRLYPQIQE